jgi:hypothetical protein
MISAGGGMSRHSQQRLSECVASEEGLERFRSARTVRKSYILCLAVSIPSVFSSNSETRLYPVGGDQNLLSTYWEGDVFESEAQHIRHILPEKGGAYAIRTADRRSHS